jgi:hypothetical protein
MLDEHDFEKVTDHRSTVNIHDIWRVVVFGLFLWCSVLDARLFGIAGRRIFR